MTYQTKKKNFINSLNNNMNLVEDSANSIGWPVDTIREAYIHFGCVHNKEIFRVCVI